MSQIQKLKQTLIVSCQAEDDFPLNKPEHLAALAATAVIGGASAIRASGPDNIRAIKEVVDVPIIGIYKNDYAGFDVRITPTIAEVEAIVAAGSDIIAVDATNRPRPDGQSLESFFKAMRSCCDLPIMADVSTFEEGIEAAQLGADIVATTLSGYTVDSQDHEVPNIGLIRELAAAVDIPIIAEGRISTPNDVQAALAAGAHAVVVGSMITRPHLITEHFVAATKSKPATETVIALDIGGTKIAGGVVNGDGKILADVVIPTPIDSGGPAILEQSIQLIEQLQEQYQGPSPTAIGISTGGQISQAGQIIGGTEMIPNWVGLPLQERFTSHFSLPAAILNDGHAAALAEAKLGAGHDYKSMLCLVIGTGLGGGLVVDGKVQHGTNGLTGSIGQMKVSRDGINYLPLEAIVSGTGLLQSYNKLVSQEATVQTGQAVAALAQAGNQAACQVIEEMGDWLGLGISHAVHTYDVDCVILGGSVAQIGSLLFDAVRRGLQKYGHTTAAETAIFPAMLGPQAGLVGAALHVQ